MEDDETVVNLTAGQPPALEPVRREDGFDGESSGGDLLNDGRLSDQIPGSLENGNVVVPARCGNA
uniref:Uncharacterized protein n=1 Tax=Anopheles dirus TaxID=7168 RepID=A0A182NYV5_9DIPT